MRITLLLFLLAACSTEPDYGTDQSAITLLEIGGSTEVDEALLYAQAQPPPGNATPPNIDSPLVPAIRNAIAKCTDDTIYNHAVNDCDDFANRLAECVKRNGGEAGTIGVKCGTEGHRISYVCTSNTDGSRLCCAIEPQRNNSAGNKGEPILGCQTQPAGVQTTPSFGPDVTARVCFDQPGTITGIWPGAKTDKSDIGKDPRMCERKELPTCTQCDACCLDEYRTNPFGSWLDQCKGWCKDRMGAKCPAYNWSISVQ